MALYLSADLSFGPAQPAQMLIVTKQLKPAPQYRRRCGLADVLGRGPALRAAVHRKAYVQPVRRLPGEGVPRLRAQPICDHMGKSPGEYRKAARAGGAHGSPGGCLVIGVAGDAGLVENKQAVWVMTGESLQHLAGKLGLRNGCQAAVTVVKQVDTGYSQHRARLPELAFPHAVQARADLIHGRCLTPGAAQDTYLRARAGQPVDDGSEAERLVVRMSHHDQDARPRRQHRSAEHLVPGAI